MGSSDVPPSSAPPWLTDAANGCLGAGVFFWLVTYVLMVHRAHATRATPVPLLPLGVNLAWECVFVAYVCDTWLEYLGFALWLLFDIPVLLVTAKYASASFASQPMVARNVGKTVGLTFVVSAASIAYFSYWWLAEPHRGYGIKWGKTWKELEARDTTELSYWTAGVAQMLFSVGALSMLVQRGHSGGQSYAIWFCRFVGTMMGLPVTTLLLWWYWPEAHGFVLQPASCTIVGVTMICDLIYPFVLAQVQATEEVLPDGTVIAPWDARASKKHS
ncbi:uncharacterized protein F5Z01DRAFT_671855 [Emericellopsis atlantica]|uniref:PaxB protein n=1 Tax=Emericellopsis atlantica TaxID=2614577 RepID=A0A9P7ZRN8_9HYPO|nr:uncharacterized protein F5Z01DRAFT_671855 [Emericellopsis atlantica]KAG9256597.1 hypothetical protein F5Z01DRAFT_671855 [Emericellopsis atlantica]